LAYKDAIDKVARIFFGDYDKVLLTGIIVILVGWFYPRVAIVLLVIWLLLLERRLRR